MTRFRCAVYPLLLTATVIVVTTGNKCQLEQDAGLCRAAFRRFYYNWNKRQCQPFIYGGCGGNDNRFETQEECERACTVPSGNSDCNLPKEPGLCLALFPSFFYDLNTGTCERFNYGGCGGNDNRFETREECERACIFPSWNSDCNLPKETGPCRALFRSFFYNPNSGKCERFIYGGCGGNANRFDSEADCEQSCGVVCQEEPKVVGRCRGSIRRWSYNRQTMTCERFNYGGCGGNRNNFLSLLECRRQCMPN